MPVFTNKVTASAESQLLLPARKGRKSFFVRNQCRDFDFLVNLDGQASRDSFVAKLKPDSEWSPPTGFIFAGDVFVAWDLGPPDCEVSAPSNVFAVGVEQF
jgi:hypothetical protein